VDIHTDNITWTGDAKEQKLRAKIPDGTIYVTLRPRGNVLYNLGTGYLTMTAAPRSPAPTTTARSPAPPRRNHQRKV